MADLPQSDGSIPQIPQQNQQQSPTAANSPPVSDISPDNSINVVNPDGQTVSIDQADLHDAVTNWGFRVANSDDIARQAAQDKYGGVGQGAIAGLEAVGQGIAGPLAPIAERMAGIPGADIAGRAAAHPGVAATGTAAGLIGSSIYGVGLGPVLHAAGEGAEAAAGLSAATGIGGKIAAGAVRGAAENALFQAGDEVTRRVIGQDPDTSAQSAIANIGLAAVLGGGLGGAASGVGGLWSATVGPALGKAIGNAVDDSQGLPMMRGAMGKVARQAMSMGTGVSEDDIAEYLANRDAIGAAPGQDELYQHAMAHVQAVNDAVASGQLGVDGAQAAYNDVRASMTQEFRQQGYEARDAARKAKDAMDSAQESLAGVLQGHALSAADKVSQAMDALHDQVVAGSGAAKDVLDQSDAQVDISGVLKRGEELSNEISARGTPEALAQARKIDDLTAHYRQTLGETTVPARTVKPLIQGLDDLSSYKPGASNFDPVLSKAYKSMRYEFDTALKGSVPEYKEAMQPVAEQTRLLKSLSKYDTPEGAASRIKGLKQPDKYMNEMPMLRQLESATGSQFTNEIEPFVNPTVHERLMQSVPEYKKFENAAVLSNEFKNPAKMQELRDAIAATPEHAELMKAQAVKEAALVEKAKLEGNVRIELGRTTGGGGSH